MISQKLCPASFLEYLANIQNPIFLQISYENAQLGKLKLELKSNFIRLK